MEKLTAREFADRTKTYLRIDGSESKFWYGDPPVKSRARNEWLEGVGHGGRGRIPDSIIFPEGAWDEVIVDPKSDPSKLKVDQPIICRINGGELKRHFAGVIEKSGSVLVWNDGKTSYTTRERVLVSFWRLPTAEELGGKE